MSSSAPPSRSSSATTTVRRPEQGTRPKAFYLGAADAVLDPLVPVHEPIYLWSERRTGGANLIFPVHPDPVSGQHAWHQRVRAAKARPEDREGDIYVDTDASRRVYREWLALARPGPGPGGLRRPEWLLRPLRPVAAAYRVADEPPPRLE